MSFTPHIDVSFISGLYTFAPTFHTLKKRTKTSSDKKIAKSCKSKLKKLKGILLAVQYNNAYYDSIHMLTTFYKPVFGKVVFCGNHYDESINLIHSPDFNGYQGYNCLRKAIDLHPGYEGYLFTNDDALIFWWNLVKYNISKFWIMEDFLNPIRCYYDLTSGKSSGWSWWDSEKVPNLPNFCGRAISKVSFSSITKTGKDLNLKTYIENRKFTCKKSNLCFCGFADTFYVPKSETKTFVFLSDIFAKEAVYLEAAVPTMMSFLINTRKKNYQILSGTIIGLVAGYRSESYTSGRAIYEHIDLRKDYIHPVKFGSHNMSIANKNIFKNAVIPYGNLFTKMCNSANE